MKKPDRNNTRRKLTLRSQTISIISLSRQLRDDQGRDAPDGPSTSMCCITSTR
jgi:hypothetical protein